MSRERVRRPIAFAWLALLVLSALACYGSVGVGAVVPVHGGWGTRPGDGYVGGGYVGGPSWP
jgi:hypothetical protein